MRHFKILWSLIMALAAMLAFAGSAMATSVTSTTGGATTTPTVHLVNSGGHVKLSNPIANIECSSTIQWTVEKHGAGVTTEGKVLTLEFTGCTNSWHVTSSANGSFFIHWTGGHNGLLGSTGMQIDTTRLGVTCVYETANTKLGNVTGGNPATISNSGSLPINGFLSSPLCGTGGAAFSGGYATTSALYVEN